MIVLHDDAHLLIFEIIEILWHKDSRFLDFSPQEQTIFLARNSAISPLFLRRYSIDSPSILHRWSIVSMEERWSIDGLTMEYPWNFGYIGYLCFEIFAVCFHNLLNLFGCFRKKLYICNQLRIKLRIKSFYPSPFREDTFPDINLSLI